jgi:anti-sigma regulatory factor (Ser/Thr protein kinase)
MNEQKKRKQSDNCVVEESTFSIIAEGAFLVCDDLGQAIFSGADNLKLVSGLSAGSTVAQGTLSEVLGVLDSEAWATLFPGSGPETASLREDSISCLVPGRGKHLIRVRHSPVPGSPGRRLVFLKDETELAESRGRLARAQSIDADASARLQATVLVNGEHVDSTFLEYACSAMPSKLVDGDFLDVVRLAPDSVDVLLGDVMGKGMDAAIMGAVIKVGLFRSLAVMPRGEDRAPSVRDICAAAERVITPHLLARRSIATFSYMRLHETESFAEFVDFGHTPMVHYRKATDSCRLIKGADMPLGFVGRQDFRSFLLPCREGDLFIVFSDGLSECPGHGGTYFGEERIMHVARSRAGIPARELSDTLRTVLTQTLDVAGSIDPVEHGGLVLACVEALSNIAEHGLGGLSGHCLVEWRIRAGLFSVEFSYKGPDIDWLARPESRIGSYASRGYGVQILHAAMDSVLLCKGFGNEKTLVLCRSLMSQKK